MSPSTQREFQVGDYAYLRLQLYHQTSISMRKNVNLLACYYGPFEVHEKICKVTYRLKLTSILGLHPIFHVSQLKKKIGECHSMLPNLPKINSNDSLAPTPSSYFGSMLSQRKTSNSSTSLAKVITNRSYVGSTRYSQRKVPKISPQGQGDMGSTRYSQRKVPKISPQGKGDYFKGEGNIACMVRSFICFTSISIFLGIVQVDNDQFQVVEVDKNCFQVVQVYRNSFQIIQVDEEETNKDSISLLVSNYSVEDDKNCFQVVQVDKN